jgi:hypothetical protein
MSHREYENPVEQVMFILGLKRDPKFETSLHAIAHGSRPGTTNAIDQLTVYGAIQANLKAWAGTVEKIHDELGAEIPSTLKDEICQIIVEELDETHYGGKWHPGTKAPPEHWVNMGPYSSVFKKGDKVFCLPLPYFRVLSSLFTEFPVKRQSADDMFSYIEDQEGILDQLDDALGKKTPKPHEGIVEAPTPFRETERLAIQGDRTSQYNLAIAYSNGDGATRDLETAEYWLSQAAENGFAPAQYNIGCYCQDSGELQKAFDWFMMAAKQNFGPAQFNLGVLCGKAGDYARAYIWFSLASRNRVEHAGENRNQAASFLSKEDLNQARLAVSAMMMDQRR